MKAELKLSDYLKHPKGKSQVEGVIRQNDMKIVELYLTKNYWEFNINLNYRIIESTIH